MSSDEKILKFPLQAQKLTPAELLEHALADADDMSAVSVVVQWKSGYYCSIWSQQTVGELCAASKVLDIEVIKALQGETE